MTIKRKNHGRNHSYWDGDRKLDGVTTLIGDGIPKKALTGWAARSVAEFVVEHLVERDGHIYADDLLPALQQLNQASNRKEKWDGISFKRVTWAKILAGIPYVDRDTAANRGTEVHKLAERLARGEEVTVPDELAGHVDSYLKFLDQWEPRVVATELVVFNRQWQYAGTADLIADFPPPFGRCLVDLKTSRSGIWAETALQENGYAGAEGYLDADGNEHPMSELGIERLLAVWVRSDGYDVYPVQFGERIHKDLLHAAWVARWTKRNDDLIGPSLRPPEPWPVEIEESA